MSATEKAVEMCGWFAGCDKPAAYVVEHPTLGDVPICERCKTRGDEMGWPATYGYPPLVAKAQRRIAAAVASLGPDEDDEPDPEREGQDRYIREMEEEGE